jgi:hypothetical protein
MQIKKKHANAPYLIMYAHSSTIFRTRLIKKWCASHFYQL